MILSSLEGCSVWICCIKRSMFVPGHKPSTSRLMQADASVRVSLGMFAYSMEIRHKSSKLFSRIARVVRPSDSSLALFLNDEDASRSKATFNNIGVDSSYQP